MKKSIFCILAFICCLSIFMLVGCNPSNSGDDSTTPEETTPAPTDGDGDTTPGEDVGEVPGDELEPATYKIVDNIDMLKITGRYSKLGGGITWDWSAAGIEFNVLCEGDIVFNFTSEGTVFFAVWIDGDKVEGRFEGTNGTNTVKIASGLKRGEHTIKISRMTSVNSSKAVMLSLNITGELLTPPAEKKYFIEFLGDSITSGTGVVDGWQEVTTGRGGYMFMDATQTFAFLLANDYLTNCDYSFVSIPGAHIARSSKYDNFLDVWEYTNFKRSTSESDIYVHTRKADMVVVNLGTNDEIQLLNTDEFKQNLSLLIEKLHQKHGDDVKIVFVYNMMYGTYFKYILEVVDAEGGEAAGLYTMKATSNRLGADGHPNADGHLVAAEELVTFIERKGLLQ